jgi:hypothetical protein
LHRALGVGAAGAETSANLNSREAIMDSTLEDLAFIYSYYRHQTRVERRHELREAAAEDGASGDAFPGWIVSDTGDVILNPRDLLLRIGFSERWISNVIGPAAHERHTAPGPRWNRQLRVTHRPRGRAQPRHAVSLASAAK